MARKSKTTSANPPDETADQDPAAFDGPRGTPEMTAAPEAPPADSAEAADAVADSSAPEGAATGGAATGGAIAGSPGEPARDLPGDVPSDAIIGAEAGIAATEAADAGPDNRTPDPPRGTADAARPQRAVSAPPPAASGGSGGGFVAGLIGGALAVAGGVGLLWLSNPDLLTGRFPEPDLSAVEGRLEAQSASVAALADDVASLRAEVEQQAGNAGPPGDALAALEENLTGRLDTLGAEIEALSARVEVLDGRIGQVEARPPVMGGDAASENAEALAELRAALAAQRAEFDKLYAEARERIDAAAAEAARLRQDAEAAARTTVARAAFSRLSAALEAGGPFAGALSELTEVADVAVPPELIAAADTGVPTMEDLVRSFPDAARAALAAAIRAGVDAEAGAMERLGAFLRAQTGARSITPREGGDPDAVLSRAEAALVEGRLDDALALVDTLPEPARIEMADWRAAAERRRIALAAAATLSSALPVN